MSVEAGEGLGGLVGGFCVAFVSIDLSEALPTPWVSSTIPAIVLPNIFLGFILPVTFFFSDIEDLDRTGLGYSVGYSLGGSYWWHYASWYAVQMILEGVLALVVGIRMRIRQS